MEASGMRTEYEYITPTTIESEVPSKQEIRECDANEIAGQDSTLDLDNKVDNPNDFVLSPVITVTKQESEFTKGDLKLQKVSVTENISEEKEVTNGAIYYTNFNPNIHAEVITGPQPIRVADDNNSSDPSVNNEEVIKPEDQVSKGRHTIKTNDDNETRHAKMVDDRGPKDEEHKAKTRIPTLKFKQAAQDIRERISDKKVEVPPPRLMQKRSSIPRLKDSRIPPPLDRRSSKPDIIVKTPQTDDEFEKIYDEIVTEPKEMVIEAIENIKVEDPEKLENKFEEIIHDYEENKVHPITDDIPIVEKPRSKIPLSKRKSEQDIKIPKPVERVSNKKDEPKPEKQVIESRIPMHKDASNKAVMSKYNIPRSDDKPNEVFSNKVVVNKQISMEKSRHLKSNNGYDTKIYESTVKEPDANQGSEEKPMVISSIEDLNPEIKPEPILLNHLPIIENKLDEPSEQNTRSNIDKSNKTVPEKENNISYIQDDQDSIDLEYKPGKVNRLLQRIRSQEFGPNDPEPKKENPINVPKKKSVLSKIAMFERPDSEKGLVSRLPRSNKLPFKKVREIKVETMQEEIMDTKPIIVDELLKDNNIDSTVHEVTVDDPLSEQEEHKTNKHYKVEIEDEAVKYLEVQVINPVEEIQIDDIKDTTPVLNGIDKPIVECTPSIRRDNRSVKLINKFEPYSVSREETPKLISNEFLQPTIENIDEKVPQEIVIETMEFKPTEYEIRAQMITEENYLGYKDINNDKEEVPIESITLQETKIESLEFKPIDCSSKFENRDDVFNKESKVGKWRRLNENGEHKRERPKSVADIDLGDAVRGKVHQMIVRMNSFEKKENNKKEIDSRERPRKKSVSKIIALFEQKSVHLEKPTNQKPELTTKQSPPKTLSEEEYQEKISELTKAKVVFGRAESMTYIVLNNGVEMPVLSVGTALLDRLTRSVIEAAIDMGYRAIDSAYIYGNEKEVGEAIRAKIDDGTVTRDDLFVTNKLWSTFHRSDLVQKACEASLKAMGLKYFDLYLIHNPISFKEGNNDIPKIANVVQYSDSDYMDAWFGMEDLVSKGLVKSIGLSNFNSRQIQRVLDKARIKPVINQVECHPYLTQERLDTFCTDRDIKLSCFGVLGSKGTPAEHKSDLTPVIDDPLVQVLAAGLKITPAQLLIRYQIDCGHNAVVKASSAAHLWDNLQSLNVCLEQAQIKALNALNRNKRYITFEGMGDTHRNYPFKIPF